MQNARQAMRNLDETAPDGPAGLDVDGIGKGMGVVLPASELALYVRYVRALALLCECAPYVDECDYVELIDELLADACDHYPLVTRRHGALREIAPANFVSDLRADR